MGTKFVVQFKEKRRGQERDLEDEEPEDFIKSLLVDNFEEAQAAFKELDEEKKQRFYQFMTNKNCMESSMLTELEINTLS